MNATEMVTSQAMTIATSTGWDRPTCWLKLTCQFSAMTGANPMMLNVKPPRRSYRREVRATTGKAQIWYH